MPVDTFMSSPLVHVWMFPLRSHYTRFQSPALSTDVAAPACRSRRIGNIKPLFPWHPRQRLPAPGCPRATGRRPTPAGRGRAPCRQHAGCRTANAPGRPQTAASRSETLWPCWARETVSDERAARSRPAMRLLQPSGTRGGPAAAGREADVTMEERERAAQQQSVGAFNTLPRQGMRHTSSSGTRWGYADAGQPSLPTHRQRAQGSQTQDLTTAAPPGAVRQRTTQRLPGGHAPVRSGAGPPRASDAGGFSGSPRRA